MAIVKQIDLFYKDYRSDKEYHLTIERTGGVYQVIAKYGPRNGTLVHVDKTKGYVTTLWEAQDIFDKTEKEKRAKGYKDSETPRQKLVKRMQNEVGMWITGDYSWNKLAKWIEAYVEEQT